METFLSSEQPEKPESNLNKLLEKIALNLEKEGIPVGPDCRIDMEKYEGIYAKRKIETDINKALEIGDFRNENKNKRDGEKFESFKTILFNKFIGGRAIIARASIFDDAKHGIDNIIMDKETGGIICAFDEVASTENNILSQKVEKVIEKNKRGGGVLDYGIYKEGKEIKLGRISNIPVFYLAISRRILDHMIKNLRQSLDEISEDEKKLFFDYFCKTITEQADALIENNFITANHKDLIKKLFGGEI